MVTNLKYSFKLATVEVGDPNQTGVNYVSIGTKIEHTRNNDSGNTAQVILNNEVTTVVTPAIGQEIIISRGVTSATESYVFRGEVKEIDFEGDKYVLKCKDKLNQLKYLLFSASYDKNIDSEAGELSAIFTSIVENGGFSTNVVSSGTSATDIMIDKFISDDNSRLDRMNLISSILNWFYYYDYDNENIRFEPKGETTFSTPLITGTNIFNVLKWNEDLESVRNKIKIKGAFTLDTRNETETGDGATKVFNFTYVPVSTNCTIDGALKKQGLVDSSSDYDYTIDEQEKTYTFLTAPALDEEIIMNYTTKIAMPVTDSDYSSQTKYGLVQEAVFTFKDIVTVDDATTRLIQLLEKLKDAPISTTMHTDEYDVKVGDKVLINDENATDKNGEYIVFSKIINYGSQLDIIKVGTEKFNVISLFTTIDERLKMLEQDDNTLSEILRQIISFSHIYFLNRYDLTNQKRVMAGAIYGHPDLGVYGTAKYGDDTAFILGHATYGLLGTSALGDGGASWATVYEVTY